MPNRLIELIPLPDGTRITTAKLVGAGPLIVAGYVPGNVAQAAEFFQRELRKSGFTLTGEEASAGRARMSLEGNGLRGRWEVTRLAGCRGSVALTISVSEQ